VRWYAPTIGGAAKPRFIMASELAFEARLQALTERLPATKPLQNRHVRLALQRHVSESMLAALPVEPAPTVKQVQRYAAAVRARLVAQVGGELVLRKALTKNRLSEDELFGLLTRRARAGWYLDKMVAPMLAPSEVDLRDVHQQGLTPFTNRPFAQVRRQLESWYLSTRLADALDSYYRSVRTRVTVHLIAP
jgi:hypothetical protein